MTWRETTHFDSEDDYRRTGCRNVGHCQQQSYSGLRSPGRSNSNYIYSFISLLLFNKNNTWRPTCFIIQTTGFNRPVKFLILSKHWGYDNFELNWFHGVVKESSDSLFPGERPLISLQYSEMLSISLRFHCLSPDMFCTAFSHAEPPRNIHAAREVTLSRF